jgi:hypothetical protein
VQYGSGEAIFAPVEDPVFEAMQFPTSYQRKSKKMFLVSNLIFAKLPSPLYMRLSNDGSMYATKAK